MINGTGSSKTEERKQKVPGLLPHHISKIFRFALFSKSDFQFGELEKMIFDGQTFDR